jgi:hypothetical protein
MRSKEKAIYLLIGFALAVTAFLSLGAVNANEQGGNAHAKGDQGAHAKGAHPWVRE